MPWQIRWFSTARISMDTNSTIKHYVKPDGTLVVRAFCVRNLIFKTDDGNLIKCVLLQKHLAFKVGIQFDIQKNRMNGQIIWFQRDNTYPDYCHVRISLNLLWRAQTLGQGADNPLCVYQDKARENQRSEYILIIEGTLYPSFSIVVPPWLYAHSLTKSFWSSANQQPREHRPQA